MSWNEIKRQVIATDHQVEEALAKYTLVRVDKGDPMFVSPEEKDLEITIDQMLKEMNTSLEVMSSSSDKPAVWHSQKQRLKEILNDKRSQFRMTQSKLHHMREAEALRRYMMSGHDRHNENEENANAEAILMKEHTHITNSSEMANEAVDQATQINDELRRQRQQFTTSTGQLGKVAAMVPGVNTLIKRIKDKRTRDNTILAIVIAICTCFLLWYWLNSWAI